MNKLIRPMLVGVALNLALPIVAIPFATADEIKPPTGDAKDLSFKEQLVHILVHHGQIPLSSSIIVASIVGLSVFISSKMKY